MAQPVLTLPSSAVTGTVGSGASTYLTVTLSGVPSGQSITNGTYNGWCMDALGTLQNSTFTAYNSYGGVNGDSNPPLPANGNLNGQVAWNEVNWVINNINGNIPNDVQNVIWELLDPYYCAFEPYTSLSPAAQALYLAAQQNGATFIPGPGQLVAVVLYIDGILPYTTGNVQDLIIAVPLPLTPPNVSLQKSANIGTPDLFQPVTYSYLITNNGGVPLTNITLVDDNGTPNYPADDVTLTYSGTLNPGQSVTLTSTVIPAVDVMYSNPNGTTTDGNTLIVMMPTAGPWAGDVVATLLQSATANDNTYGTNSSAMWGPQGHAFSSLLNDYAEFQFVDNNGNTVLDFDLDYLSKASMSPWGQPYPSGYGSLGAMGGAGKMIKGLASEILFASTTLTTDLNQGPAYYGFTTNSPAISNPISSNWNYVDGYTVVIAGSAFGPDGVADFGGVNIPTVLNTSNKQCTRQQNVQKGEINCNTTVTNHATVTATATVSGIPQTLTATSSATVTVVNAQSTRCAPPGVCQTHSTDCSNVMLPKTCTGEYVWFDSVLNISGMPKNLTTPVTLTMTNVTLTLNSGRQTYRISVPNGEIVLTPSAGSATTVFSAATDTWQTQAPVSSAGQVFITGVEFNAPANLPASVGVSWSGTISSNTPGVNVQWQTTGTAFNSSFGTNYSSLGVVAAGTSAGVPENFIADELEAPKCGNNTATTCVKICPTKCWSW